MGRATAYSRALLPEMFGGDPDRFVGRQEREAAGFVDDTSLP